MKHVRSLQTLLCVSLLLVCGFAQAQQPAPAQPAAQQRQAALLVGVIDMRSVLQQHPVVADEIPGLVQQLQAMQLELANKSREAEKQVEGLQQQYKYGSPDFEEKVGPIRQQMRDAQAQAQEKQQMLVAERTQMMYKAYKDIQTAIDAVARQKGIIIVHSKIKYSGESNLSEEVVALEEADQNPIVWNRAECDITDAVKAQLLANVGAPKQQANDAASPLAGVGGKALAAAAPGAGLAPAAAPAAGLAPAAARPARTANAGVAAPRR